MSSTWILVADRAKARLFSLDGNDEALVELQSFVNVEGRLPGRELQSDRPPRAHDRFGEGRHAIEPHTRPREKAARRFANQLGGMLDKGRATRRYDELVLIAPPAFMGELNTALGAQTGGCVVAKVSKNLTAGSLPEVRDALPSSFLRHHRASLLARRWTAPTAGTAVARNGAHPLD
ncbi:host attachment protein [Lysobacter sp. TLK-CK17T]|uniref:Host attachment protein n=2 Tax=Marilutibacter chinensis TaxID=2912247 RepID=A0ABS9HPW3_9GAMM|nr:host attachment protein [Lysobacter chinensis]